VYRFIDAILDAAIESSPHTSPSKAFPKDYRTWSDKASVVTSELSSMTIDD